jgi:hypothetical protein
MVSIRLIASGVKTSRRALFVMIDLNSNNLNDAIKYVQ